MRSHKHSPIQIRSARAGDGPAIAALVEASLALHAKLHPDFFRAGGDDAVLVVDRHTLVLVAETPRAGVVGLLRARVYDTPRRAHMAPRRRAMIEDLSVARAHRKRGVGRALVEAARRWSVEQGAVQLLLTLWEGNAGADAFYRALGFRTVSRVLKLDLSDKGRP